MNRWIWLVLFALLLSTGCAGGGQVTPTQTAVQPGSGATSPAATLVASQAPILSPTSEPPDAVATITSTQVIPSTAGSTSLPAEAFQNPVLRRDFPDPGVMEVDGIFYAYATNVSGKNVQVARSEDLVNWEVLSDAMPALASWAQPGGLYVWAPEAIRIGERFVLYYTARDKKADRQCIGVAVSDKPEGKFNDENGGPLVCQVQEGGSIDPSPFSDGGKLYLYWKNDGNCCGLPTYLYVQELAPDGLSLVGEPARLVRNDKPWEGSVVEAPTMIEHEDSYYLFFSANDYGSANYAIGYAVCQAPTGPCEDAPENPILSSLLQKPPVIGPGHQDIVQVGNETWVVYHAWEVNSAGLKTDNRFLWVDSIIWEDGKPDVIGPTVDPQPSP